MMLNWLNYRKDWALTITSLSGFTSGFIIVPFDHWAVIIQRCIPGYIKGIVEYMSKMYIPCQICKERKNTITRNAKQSFTSH